MALEENDISIIRDQMSSLLTSVESRIDAKFSQFSSILGSNNSSISNLREDIRRFEQSSSQITGGGSGGRRRDSGLPIPVHHSGSGGAGGGGGAPNAINLAVRQASLLENGARDVAKYAQDLLTATNNIGGQLHTARALNTELRNLLQVSRSSEGAGAHTRLREYVSMQEFQDDLDTMRSQTRRFARSLSSPGNIQNGSKVLDEYMRTQGLITQREQLQLHALTGRFDETQGVADNVKELVLSMGVSSGANVAGRMTTPESVSASVDKFLQLPEEHLSFLGRSSDILEKIKNSSSVDDENFKRLNIAAQGAVKNEELAGYSASLSSVFRPDDFASQIEGMRKRITAKDVIDPRKIAALSGRISQSVDYVRQARAAGKPNEAAEDNLKSLYASFGGREGIKSFSETVGQELSEFQKKRLEGGTLTEKEEERESTLVATMQQLISALSQLGAESEASSQKQSTTIAGLISSVVGALSVQQFLMMRYVQQPYQYETLPALGAMGSTGMMGDALSGAYGAQESALQGFREFGVGGSFA